MIWHCKVPSREGEASEAFGEDARGGLIIDNK